MWIPTWVLVVAMVLTGPLLGPLLLDAVFFVVVGCLWVVWLPFRLFVWLSNWWNDPHNKVADAIAWVCAVFCVAAGVAVIALFI